MHREQQGLITDWLAGSGMKIPAGKEVTLHNEGAFFVKNTNATYVQPGLKAFAGLSDGAVLFAAAGAAPGGRDRDRQYRGRDFAATGSVAGNVLTVTALSSGTSMLARRSAAPASLPGPRSSTS